MQGDHGREPSTHRDDAQIGRRGRESGLNMPLLRDPACIRCRQQKLKCSKTKPACQRCINLAKTCSYPSPPDRRRLFAERQRHGQWDKVHEIAVTSLSRPPFQLAPVVGSDSISPSPPQQMNEHSHLPSSEIAMFLIEVYFSRIYNATLLYHKPRFISDWISGRLPSFIALSIFASASIFLKNQNPPNAPSALSISSYDWQKSGEEWAVRAGREVLAQADIPSIATVQACHTLALYWLACGQTQRTNFHVHVAYRACRMLGIQHGSSKIDDPTTAENRRRCLWACWITQCISQDNAMFRSRSWDEVSELPLPSDEASYSMNDPHPTQYLSSSGEVQWLNREDTGAQRYESVMAELAKLAGVWWAIYSFQKGLSTSSNPEVDQHLSKWMNLQGHLEKIDEGFPSLYRQIPPSCSDPEVGIERCFSLACLWHACCCILNASIVPLYSPSRNALNIPKLILRTAAQEVIDHSSAVLSMANELHNRGLDPSKISALTGYCLYVCIHVQQKFASTQLRNRRNLISINGALSILIMLQDYWHSLRNLVTKLRMQSEQLDQMDLDRRTGAAKSSPEHNLANRPPNEISEIVQYVANEEGEDSQTSKEVVSERPQERAELHAIRPPGSEQGSYNSVSEAPHTESADRGEMRMGVPANNVPSMNATQALSSMGNEMLQSRPFEPVETAWWEAALISTDPVDLSIFDASAMENFAF